MSYYLKKLYIKVFGMFIYTLYGKNCPYSMQYCKNPLFHPHEVKHDAFVIKFMNILHLLLER